MTTEPPAPPLAPETKSFRGSFLVWRKKGPHLRTGVTKDGERAMRQFKARPPRFRHPTFESAEREAQRLAAFCPETTFIIIQEVARVKLKPVPFGTPGRPFVRFMAPSALVKSDEFRVTVGNLDQEPETEGLIDGLIVQGLTKQPNGDVEFHLVAHCRDWTVDAAAEALVTALTPPEPAEAAQP